MKVILSNKTISFELRNLEVSDRNQENIFFKNKKTLRHKLTKALNNPKNQLHKIASEHLQKYKQFLDQEFGLFLKQLKLSGNSDYKIYLNKHGDQKYCFFRLNDFKNERGIYCYVINDRIVYVGRSKKTFKERINEYGKITPYNCLIDGQSTNCNINSRINGEDRIKIGFHVMKNATNESIVNLEKDILKELSKDHDLWNIQLK